MTTKIAAATSAKAHLSKINEIHAKKKEIVTEVGGRKQKEGVLHKVCTGGVGMWARPGQASVVPRQPGAGPPLPSHTQVCSERPLPSHPQTPRPIEYPTPCMPGVHGPEKEEDI